MLLNHEKTLALLKKYNIDFPKTIITKNPKKVMFPIALKVDSEIIHKSDVGLVFTNITTIKELKEKQKMAKKILQNKKIKKYNFVIQEMVKGQEIIIGMNRDKIFGPVILFGLGGIFVELLKDVSMRIAPLSKNDCYEMINEIKGKKLLEGYRHFNKVNKELIVDILLKLSKLAMNESQIKEIDFNPVMVDKKAIVVDARIIQQQNSK